jgi:hypothetical protein
MSENESSIISKPKYRKNDLYKKEQEDLLIQILQKIGINRNNLSIDKKHIENDENKEFIRNKKYEIKNFYCVNNWNSTKKGQNIELNTLRYMCRYNNIKINIIVKQIKEDKDRYLIQRIYNFLIPDEILNKL